MQYGDFYYPMPANEPVLAYAPGSAEKKRLKEVLKELKSTKIDVPMYIGNEEVRTGKTMDIRPPHEHKYVIARQLLKSGTSIGANTREAQNAESKPDFIHKLKIAAKEADETEYWLLLCKNSASYENCDEMLEDCNSIIKVLSKIIATSKLKSIN